MIAGMKTNLATAIRSTPLEEPIDRYAGLCSICATKGSFERGGQASVREAFACPACRASLRYRDQAASILDEFGQGMDISLTRLARSGRMDHLKIYEPALGGPFNKLFSGLPGYRQSYYWDGGVRGDIRSDVPFEDLCNLSFADESFDLVITSDVFEHIIDPYAAFAEVARVLKVGGIHAFSIPTAWPFPEKSVTRIRIEDDEIQHILPPRYHRAGDGSPSLVITDFGADIIANLDALGLKTQVQRLNRGMDPLYQNATFVSRRMR
jgi:SAM-dependent methyltransferase